MKINVKTFSLLLRKHGLTQAALAERARLGVKTVGRIRKGQDLRPANAEKIATALGVSVSVLEAPPSEELEKKAGKSGGLQRIVADLDVASVNALTLTSLRYGVDEKWILEASPYLFSIIAELSLKRRRDKIDRWKDGTLEAVQGCPRSHPWSLAPWATVEGVVEAVWDIYHEEIASIERRDLSGGFDGDQPEKPDAENPGNPFFEALSDLAGEAGHEMAFVGCSFNYAPTPLWNEIHYDAVAALLASNDGTFVEDAAWISILDGNIALRDMPEELMKSGSGSDRRAWVYDQPAYRECFDRSLKQDNAQPIAFDESSDTNGFSGGSHA
jgi:transcriptional regulator with XRE-family HTH domain